MGLVHGVAIITQADVESITGLANLTNLDSSGSATLAAALVAVTDSLILWIRDKGIDPTKVGNVQDLIVPAALLAAYTRLSAQSDDESQTLADKIKTRFNEAIAQYVFVSSDPSSTEQTLANKGLPRGVNLDSAPFFGATDNRRPSDSLGPYISGFGHR